MSTNGKHAGIGDEAVKAKTGRTWHEWMDTLDKAGGRTRSHQQIAALLSERNALAQLESAMT